MIVIIHHGLNETAAEARDADQDYEQIENIKSAGKQARGLIGFVRDRCPLGEEQFIEHHKICSDMNKKTMIFSGVLA